MPCYHPLTGYFSKEVNRSGRRSIVFNPAQALEPDRPIKLACGQCIGCRLEYSRAWAVRIMHEASLYEDNCFVTLTYDNDHLPKDGTLVLEDFQKFMKRLRKRFPGQKIRYYHCGEYGEKFARPHYHVILFNLDFPDKKEVQEENYLGDKYYVSEILGSLWTSGISRIGQVSFESAAYVARYVTKKVNGERAEDHYSIVDQVSGEVRERRREKASMSKGIGKGWFEKYMSDLYPSDFVVMRGKKMNVPSYYDSQYEMLYPEEFESIKEDRLEKGKSHYSDNCYDRLMVREEVQEARVSILKRGFENET